MTEGKLKGKIAEYITKQCRFCDSPAYSLSPQEMAYGIIELIKEAGHLSHEAVQTMLNTLSGGMPEILKIQGYVKLAENQKFPAIQNSDTIITYISKLRDWRRVKLEVKDGQD